MKKIAFLLPLFGGIHFAKAQTNSLISSPAPAYTFNNLMNSPVQSATLSSLKNKVVILEFWATWCGPCLTAMEHLSQLQKKFNDQVVIIAVSDETEERVKKYISNKPSGIWFSREAENLRNNFLYITIPHTVVVDKTGKIVAITRPENVTEDVITQLLDGRTVTLEEKNDGEGFDYTKDYFNIPPGIKESFQIQPAIKGGMSIDKKYKGEYKGRRKTMINLPVNLIYAIAYGFTTSKVIYETPKGQFENRDLSNKFCIDIIVPEDKKDQLLQILRQKLSTLDMEVKARIEKRKMTVAVISSIDSGKIELTPSKENGSLDNQNAGLTMNHGDHFTKNGITVDQFVEDYFNAFNLFNKPAVNETGITGKYDFDFSFQGENKQSFFDELNKLGLKVKAAEREVEVLVIYK